MRVAIPITIDDTNMTTDAPLDTYDTWGTTQSTKAYYPATASQTTLGDADKRVWENHFTGDMYIASGNILYKQTGGSGNFSVFLEMPDFSVSGIIDITGNASKERLYVTGLTDSTGDAAGACTVYEVSCVTASYSIWYSTDNIKALDFDETSSELYIFTAASATRYKKITGGTSGTVIYSSGTSGITCGAVDAYTKNVWVGTSDEGILLQTAGTGTATLITGTDSYAWDYLSVDRVSLNVFGVISTNDIYYQVAGTGSFALYDDTKSFSSVYCSWRTLSVLTTLTTSNSAIYIDSSKFFAEDEYCIYDGNIYVALANNLGVLTSVSTVWFDYGATNPNKMFDGTLSSVTTATGEINIELDNDNVTDMVFFGVEAQSITVTLTVDAVEVYSETKTLFTVDVVDWYEYFFLPTDQINDIAFTNIPKYGSGTLDIVIAGGSPTVAVQVGLMVCGFGYAVGDTLSGISPGFQNYSTTEIDDFGRITIVERKSAKTIDCNCKIDSRTDASAIITLYSRIKDLKCVWIASSDLEPWSLLYGICKRFDPVLEHNQGSYSLQLLGIV